MLTMADIILPIEIPFNFDENNYSYGVSLPISLPFSFGVQDVEYTVKLPAVLPIKFKATGNNIRKTFTMDSYSKHISDFNFNCSFTFRTIKIPVFTQKIV